jgi:hypothetical protein
MNIHDFCGLKIITSPLMPDETPVLQVRDIRLKDGTPILSPKFLSETNDWLLKRFGKQGVAFMFGGPFGDSKMYISPQNMLKLKTLV